jgi:hypothetical protein
MQLIYCITNLTQSGADACVHQAATDPSIVAVVGSGEGENISTGLAAAGLAEVDAGPLDPRSWTSANSFPSNPGGIATAAGAALAVNDLHLKKVALLLVGLPQAQAVIGLVNKTLTSWNAPPLVNTVSIPITASDVAPEVSAAAHGAQSIITSTTPTQQQQIFVAAKQLGITVPIITASSYWTPQSLKSFASQLQGANAFSYFPTDDVSLPGNAAYLHDMDASGEQGQISEEAKSAWIAFDMFNTACHGLTTITRATILNAMTHLTGYDAGGLTPTISFDSPGPLPPFVQLHNLTYYWSKVSNGQFVSGPNRTHEPIFGTS